MAFRPMIFGHQLLGDSHMVNLSKMLGYNLDWHQPERIGLCLSGQSIPGLRGRLENTEIHERVMVMIGNNDFQRGVDSEIIKMHFLNLVEYLLSRVRSLVILTLVPSPELIDGEAYRLRSMGFNRWLLSVDLWELMGLEHPRRVTVIDVSSQFVDYYDGIQEDCFEMLDQYTIGEPDGLHLTKHGLRLMMGTLERSSKRLHYYG